MNRFIIIAFVTYVVAIFSCTHDPIYTTPDTTDLNGDEPCDPDIIYYEKDVQPIFNASCAYAGCHDAITAEHKINLSTYVTAIKEVRPGKLSDSEIYEVITATRADKRMPPDSRLPADLIATIEKWILQGAQNVTCDVSASECNSSGASYSGDINHILTMYCYGCHAGAVPLGRINLDTYASVKKAVDNGTLLGTVTWQSGFLKMPDGLPKLDSCNISKIKNWIDNGSQNN